MVGGAVIDGNASGHFGRHSSESSSCCSDDGNINPRQARMKMKQTIVETYKQEMQQLKEDRERHRRMLLKDKVMVVVPEATTKESILR